MSFTVDGSHCALFGGDAYAQVQITATKNAKNNTFTVKVDGLRGYSKYEWNFGQRVQMWLAEDSKGTGKVSLTTGSNYVSIPSSGSDSYRGWIPKTGYQTTCSITKTFNGKSDGTCPTVYLYFKDWNPSITWINKGTQVSFESTYSGDISSLVKTAIGSNDVTAPSLTVTKGSYNATEVNFTASSTSDCDIWQYKVDSGSWTNFSTTVGKSATGKATVTSENHTVYIRARKDSNEKYSDTKSLSFDCTLPTITGFTVTPVNSTNATISFSCNYECQYVIKKPGDTAYPTTWSSKVAANTTKTASITVASVSGTYTIKVRRTSDSDLTKTATASCDTVNPTISSFTISNTSNTSATATFNVSHAFKYRIKYPDGTYNSSSYSSALSAGTNHSTTVSAQSGTYTLYVRRSSCSGLTATKTDSNDVTLPSILTFTLFPITSTSASATIKVDTDFKYRIKLPNGTYQSSWSTVQTSNTDITTVVTGNGAVGTYTLEVQKSTDTALTASKTASCDCTLPMITNVSLVAETNKTGKLSATFSHPCSWQLKDGANTLAYGGPSVKSITSQQVGLPYNTNKVYTLVAYRDTSTGLSRSTVVSCDTSMPTIVIDSVKAEANTCTVVANSNVSCKDWKCVFSNASVPTVTCSSTTKGTKCTFLTTSLQPGVSYTVEVSATKESNGITNTVVYGANAKCMSSVRIFINGEWKSASVYVYNGGVWKPCLPYVYDGNSWKLCE